MHEPIVDIGNIVDWRLVSPRVSRDAPLMWNFWDGLNMSPYTSPVDNRPYHKVCGGGRGARLLSTLA